jgi:hypothetical protein
VKRGNKEALVPSKKGQVKEDENIRSKTPRQESDPVVQLNIESHRAYYPHEAIKEEKNSCSLAN